MDIKIFLIIKQKKDKEFFKQALWKIKGDVMVTTFFAPSDAHMQLNEIMPNLIIIDSLFGNEAIVEFSNILVQKCIDIPYIVLFHDNNMVFFMAKHIYTICRGNDHLFELSGLTEGMYKTYLHEKEQSVVLQKISDSQKALQGLIDAIRDPIFVHNLDYEIIRMNKAFADIYDKHPTEIVGKKCYELICCNFPLDVCPANKVFATGETVFFEQTRYNRNYYITISPFINEREEIVAAIHVMKDITEMRQLRDKLYNSEKLASIGRLVSGVAHEINNQLTGVMGYTQLLSTILTDSKHMHYLSQIVKSAEKCKGIIDNLLTFSRQKKPIKTLGYINEAIQKTLELRAYDLRKKKISMIEELNQVRYIKFDFQQIQQVILNIIVNAEDAIVSMKKEDGEIRIKTNSDRDWVHIHISNNGPSISQEEMRRIFDPLYTTKGINEGTGLGLSIAYGIIKDHGGDISVHNLSEKEGVCFTIKLPIMDTDQG